MGRMRAGEAGGDAFIRVPLTQVAPLPSQVASGSSLAFIVFLPPSVRRSFFPAWSNGREGREGKGPQTCARRWEFVGWRAVAGRDNRPKSCFLSLYFEPSCAHRLLAHLFCDTAASLRSTGGRSRRRTPADPAKSLSRRMASGAESMHREQLSNKLICPSTTLRFCLSIIRLWTRSLEFLTEHADHEGSFSGFT